MKLRTLAAYVTVVSLLFNLCCNQTVSASEIGLSSILYEIEEQFDITLVADNEFDFADDVDPIALTVSTEVTKNEYIQNTDDACIDFDFESCFIPLLEGSVNECTHDDESSCPAIHTDSRIITYQGTETSTPSYPMSISHTAIKGNCRYTGTLFHSYTSQPWKNVNGKWCVDVTYSGTIFHQICVYK